MSFSEEKTKGRSLYGAVWYRMLRIGLQIASKNCFYDFLKIKARLKRLIL